MKVLFRLELFQLQNDEILVELDVRLALEVAGIDTVTGIGLQGRRQAAEIPFILAFIRQAPGLQQLVDIRDGGRPALGIPDTFDGRS